MLKIAHRGALAENTENTLKAFKKSLEDGFDGIELDVRACGSGELVVFHDKSLKRLAGRPELISQMSLKELRKIKIDGQDIPLLSEVLESLSATMIFVELKEMRTAGKVIESLKKHPIHHYVVGSKSLKILREFHAANDIDHLQMIYFTSKLPIFLPPKDLSLTHVGFHHRITNWFGVWLAHRKGLKVGCYPIRNKLIERILIGHNIDILEYDRKL